MSTSLFIQECGGQWRTTVLQDGRVVALGLDDPSATLTLDSIYLAQVLEVTQGTAFLNVGLSQDVILFRNRHFPKSKVGDKFLVQITREAMPDLGEGREKAFLKRPQATRDIFLAGRSWTYGAAEGFFRPRTAYGDVTTGGDDGEREIIVSQWEQASQHKILGLALKGATQLERLIRDHLPDKIHADQHELIIEAKRLCARYSIAAEILKDMSPLDHDEVWDSLIHPLVKIPGLGSLVIEETACMNTIDVNTPDVTESTMPAILEVIANQIRWRQLSGNIIIDLYIPNDNNYMRKSLLKQMENLLSTLRPRISYINWSRLGWMEIRTEVLRPSLTRGLTKTCTTCLGFGRIEK